MASLDFPSNPTNNQTYTLNGVTYYYNSAIGAWLTQLSTMNLSTSSNTQVLFNDAGLANGSTGFTFNKANNTLYVTGNVVIGTGTTTITTNSINVGNLLVVTSQGMSVPSGNTAQRPTGVALGTLRYNTETDALENYTSGSGWIKVAVQVPAILTATGTIYSGAVSNVTFTGTL